MEEETVWLQQYYTPVVRAELIQVLMWKQTIAALWELIDAEYL